MTIMQDLLLEDNIISVLSLVYVAFYDDCYIDDIQHIYVRECTGVYKPIYCSLGKKWLFGCRLYVILLMRTVQRWKRRMSVEAQQVSSGRMRLRTPPFHPVQVSMWCNNSSLSCLYVEIIRKSVMYQLLLNMRHR